MTPLDMALECKRVLEHENELRKVALVLPRRPSGRSLRMRMAGPGSPLGEIACVNMQGHTVCYFEALDVLAWLAANELVNVEVLRRE